MAFSVWRVQGCLVLLLKKKFESSVALLVFPNAEKAVSQGRDSLDARKWRPARRVGSSIRRELAPQHSQCAARLICFLHRTGNRSSIGAWHKFARCRLIQAINSSPIANHQSPITNRQSPITNHQSPITECHRSTRPFAAPSSWQEGVGYLSPRTPAQA